MSRILERFDRQCFETRSIGLSAVRCIRANQKCIPIMCEILTTSRPTTIATPPPPPRNRKRPKRTDGICSRNVHRALDPDAVGIQSNISNNNAKLIRTFVGPINIRRGLFGGKCDAQPTERVPLVTVRAYFIYA